MNRLYGLWKLRAALTAGVNQRVTRLGLLYSLACVLIALAAFSSANNLLFLILAAMLATFMISGLVSRLSLAGLALDLVLPDHISARRKLIGRVVLKNEKRWMASFSIHLAGQGQSAIGEPLYFPLVPGGAQIEQSVEVYFARRGSYRENSFRFSTRFPFGFAERRINVVLRREVLVYPSLNAQPGFEDLFVSLIGELESHYRGQGSDFYRIRPYEALESARHVDWRATAHTGNLQVREFAREQERSVTFVMDLDVAAEHLEWFERCVDCCAFLAWNLSMKGTRLRLCSQQVDIGFADTGDIYTILKYLATVVPMRGMLPVVLDDENSFQVVFSANPERLVEAGLVVPERNVRMVGLDFTGPASAVATGPESR